MDERVEVSVDTLLGAFVVAARAALGYEQMVDTLRRRDGIASIRVPPNVECVLRGGHPDCPDPNQVCTRSPDALAIRMADLGMFMTAIAAGTLSLTTMAKDRDKSIDFNIEPFDLQ